MQVTFENVRREGNTITGKADHNCGEHVFWVRMEGATSNNDLKLITEPPEFAERDFALRGAVSLLHEVLRTGKDYY